MSLHSKLCYVLVCIFFFSKIDAQSIKNFEILYEKKINMSKLYTWWNQTDKDKKFYKENFTLKTNSEVSLYERQEKDILDESNNIWSYMTYSTTYIDIKSKKQVSQKEVGEKTFLMRDSLPKIQWHIYDETKSIAGYTCRKAMGKYNDSIVIVAYFTEQLEASVGPESIAGLPGTILGLVIPKLETTWLASSVIPKEEMPIKYFPKPSKGDQVSLNQLYEIVRKVYKDYTKPFSIIFRVLI
jgi:GLPGLI family protein